MSDMTLMLFRAREAEKTPLAMMAFSNMPRTDGIQAPNATFTHGNTYV